MVSSSPSSFLRLSVALGLSLLLHAAVMGWPGRPHAKADRPAVLEARLLPSLPPPRAEPLLKDTLASQDVRKPAPAPVASPPPRHPGSHPARPAKLDKPREQAAQRKLAAHLYYPEEAVEQGLEGEVRLLLALDAAGRILSVEIAAGSGHPILDRAAMAAARAMGSLPDAGVKEFILPVVFRLQ